MKPCSIGLRAHSGWAALVALAGARDRPEVVLRTRLEIADASIPGSRQPYHEAEGKKLAAARTYLGRCERATRRLARAELRGAGRELGRAGFYPTSCGLLLASGRPLPALESILASHALIHTADGEHYRNALAAAAAEDGLAVTLIREREAAAVVCDRLGLTSAALARRILDMGKSLGPPWTQDQKLATMAAWIAFDEPKIAKTARAAKS